MDLWQISIKYYIILLVICIIKNEVVLVEYKNSYIFLKRKKEVKKDNTIAISLSPSFKELIKKTFKNVVFDEKEDNLDIINSGTFKIKNNNENVDVCFKYHNVWSNYYLDIIVKSRKKQDAINILEVVNSSLIGKENNFDSSFVSIVSYDYISEYYCNKLFPYLNEFERKLRKVLFSIYTLNFNLEYYSATTSEEFQKGLKKKSKISKDDNISKQDCYIKLGFYSLNYSDINKLLFTKSTTLKEEQKLQKFLVENQDLTKLSDSEIREAFKLCSNKTDWERFFGDKNFDENFQQILNDIRNFRNNIAHCKFISKEQYKNCIDILKKTTKSLDSAIKITEEKDFINKNLELQYESFERLTETMHETVLNIYKPIIENIDAITQPMRELSEKLNEIVEPITSVINNIPNIVLPEIELPKFNIPNYFDLIDAEENDVKEKDNQKK